MGKPAGKVSKRQRDARAGAAPSRPNYQDMFEPQTTRGGRKLSASSHRFVPPVEHVISARQTSAQPAVHIPQPIVANGKAAVEQEVVAATREVEARVSSVYPERGFAYLRIPHGKEVYMPLNIAKRDGHPKLKSGTMFRCEVRDQPDGRGLRAERIISVVDG